MPRAAPRLLSSPTNTPLSIKTINANLLLRSCLRGSPPHPPSPPGLLHRYCRLVPPRLPHRLQHLPRALAQKDVLPAVGPGRVPGHDRHRGVQELQALAVGVQDGLAVVNGLLVAAEKEALGPHDRTVPRNIIQILVLFSKLATILPNIMPKLTQFMQLVTVLELEASGYMA